MCQNWKLKVAGISMNTTDGGKETEEVIISKNEIEEEYIDYEFTDRIVKYHDPEAVIKITGPTR